jgi:hypothetical protein
MNAGAYKEIHYLRKHGRPLLPFNRMLRSSLTFVAQNWPQVCPSPSPLLCPIDSSSEEQRKNLYLDDLNREAIKQLQSSDDISQLGPESWVSHENHEGVMETFARMKVMCSEQAETEAKRTAIRARWIYDDMDEDEYLQLSDSTCTQAVEKFYGTLGMPGPWSEDK